ncbi:MAG: phosphoribosylanthranilate isomerase [Chloracidobacterium sp.]|nr:phosphoribosylanthranilate isomerase [Chloracidobacterium sp.]MCO5334032.1 phosphoribosylanthranilate isomerase [Pyrinomonadaceae bacterium]
MTKIKICGITNVDDAIFAAGCGADVLGLNFYSVSPRYLEPEIAKQIVQKIRPLAENVRFAGVFVNEEPDEIRRIADEVGLDLIQLHGDEQPPQAASVSKMCNAGVIKAIRKPDQMNEAFLGRFDCTAFLLDGFSPIEYGGTGRAVDRTTAVELVAKGYTIYLAGGLTPENAAEAIRDVRPFAVDVASGVEISPGKKDRKKIEAFITAVRKVGRV